MKSKEEIFDLLGKMQFEKLFEELDNFFSDENDSYNGLVKEYIDRPGNFNVADFAKRLRVLINRNYEIKTSVPANNELDYYGALCELDFKLQTLNFQRIYRNKKIAAFLLHGDSDEQANDINWLCNQLLYKEKLVNTKPIIIDFDSKLGGSFERLLEEFYDFFNLREKILKEKKPIASIRNSIQKQLVAGNFICIIKSPECLLNNTDELLKLFNDFLIYLDEEIVHETNNSLIFLFVESKLVAYHEDLQEYFFCYNDQNAKSYLADIVDSEEIKIIDIAPFGKIIEDDINKWVDWSLEYPELYANIKNLRPQINEILQKGNYPFQVIKQICKKLNIEINHTWIK